MDTVIDIVGPAEYFYRFNTINQIRKWAGINSAEIVEITVHKDLLPHAIIMNSGDAVALRLTFGTFDGVIKYSDNGD